MLCPPAELALSLTAPRRYHARNDDATGRGGASTPPATASEGRMAAAERIGPAVAGIACALVLAGCLGGADSGTDRPARGGDTAAAVQGIERDVEAPEVFQATDRGLWDGRPSLGGVWVAHPEVRDPERVLIRNPDTGDEVVGALFRRERENPGPVFQVSSDAASALGMLAGAPTEIEVTALRTETVPDPATTAPASDPDTTEEDAAMIAEADAADTPDAADAEGPRRRGFWPFGRRDRSPEPEPDTALAALPDDGAVEQTALAPLPDAAPEPAATPAQPAIARGFVQLGIFSVEANAEGAARMVRDAGLEAQIRPGESQGNRFWRVIVGPASSTAERDRALSQVQALGFDDAYVVSR